jgi:hypothetical protein
VAVEVAVVVVSAVVVKQPWGVVAEVVAGEEA